MAKRSKKKIGESDIEAMIKSAKGEHYVLRLYVTGNSPKSSTAISNIRALLEEHLPGRYDLEVVDLYQQPGEARDAQIIAAPTLIKQLPNPPKRMVGDFSDKNKVLLGLNLVPAPEAKQGHSGEIKWVQI